MSFADRAECVLGDHSSEHDRSNVRECQQMQRAHPQIVAAQKVRLARHAVPVDVRRAHDVRSTAFWFSPFTEIQYSFHVPLVQPSRTPPFA